MKKILLACLVLMFFLPTPNAFSYTVDGGWVIADHRMSADGTETNQIQSYIGLTGLNSGDRPALYTGGSAGAIINTNPPTDANTGYLNDSLNFQSGINEFESYYDAGDPTVLAKFENQSFTFQLYNSLDTRVDDNLLTINTHDFNWLGFISLKNEPQGAHPIFEWDDVSNAQQYRIRIFRNTEPTRPLMQDRGLIPINIRVIY